MSKTQKLPTVYKCPHVKISHQRLLDVGCCIELYHVPFIILWSWRPAIGVGQCASGPTIQITTTVSETKD